MSILEPDEEWYTRLTLLGKTEALLNPLSAIISDLELMGQFEFAEKVREAVQVLARVQIDINDAVTTHTKG